MIISKIVLRRVLSVLTFEVASRSTQRLIYHMARRCVTTRNASLDYEVFTDQCSSNHLSPIVVAHGLFDSKTNWRNLNKKIHIDTGRKIVSYDAVNHGNSSHHADMSYESMVDDLFHLMDQLEIPKAIFLGHSMGGRTMMAASLMQPERVEKLIVVDTAPTFTSNSPSATILIQRMQSVHMSKIKATEDLYEVLGKVVKSKIIQRVLMANLTVTPDRSLRWKVNLDTLEKNVDLLHEFPEFNAGLCYKGSTQFIKAGKSDYMLEADNEEISKRFPNAFIEHVPDAGHWLHVERPKEFLKIAIKFLQN